MSRGKHWCFTLNNPTDEEEALLCVLAGDDDVEYIVWGREVGRQGTPHFQGYVCFVQRKRLRQLRLMFALDGPSRFHFESARGTPVQASDYCKKDGDYEEFGSLPANGARINPYDQFRDWCTETEGANEADIAREFPGLYLRHGERTVRMLSLLGRKAAQGQQTPRQWQEELKDELEQYEDERKIIFVVDAAGNTGKTWFCKWYLDNHPDEAQYLDVSKKADMAYAINEAKPTILINVPRGSMEYLSYSLLESLKDRMVFSPKYQSRIKCFASTVAVVVFTNEHPDMNKLSADRYDIREL